MSEHRRKAPGAHGGRAAGRGGGAGPEGPADDPSYSAATGGRAERRRAAQGRGGRRRGAPPPGGPPPGGRRAARGAAEPPSGRKRFIDYPRSGKRGWRRAVPSWKQLLSLCLLCCAGLVGAVLVAYSQVSIPSENDAAKEQNNVYYWSDGSLMAKVGDFNRQNVAYDKIPPSMRNAVVAAENSTFWTDSGVSFKGILRSVKNMAMGQETQSGSTITQQYVKNTYLNQNQNISRKLKELFISVKLDREKSKQEILRGYLNTSYFGPRGYGIQAAAKGFFGKNSEDLNPSESAMLAAVLKGAGQYDPTLSPANRKRCEERWSWILDREVQTGKMTRTERNKYRTFPKVKKQQPNKGLSGDTGYMVRTARSYVISHAHIDDKTFDHGGYEIHTTFDKSKMKALHKSVTDELTHTLKPKERKADTHVRVGAASVKPGDGAIQAIYGGPNYNKQFVNDADRQDIQIGSTFKAFVLAAALTDGVQPNDGGSPKPISVESKYNGNDNYVIKGPDGSSTGYKPGNDNGETFGYISLRRAMYHSVNTVYAQLGENVGLSNVRDAAVKAGILKNTPALDLHPSIALGVSQPSAIRLADAYATFAARGMHADPYSVKTLKHNGEVDAKLDKPKKEQVFKPEVADVVNNVLKGVIYDKEGTGFYAKKLHRDAAGKTGTTNNNLSAWFAGYTPKLSTAVGMWREENSGKRLSMRGLGSQDAQQSVNGGAYPTEIWTNYMIDALNGDKSTFTKPPSKFGSVMDMAGAPKKTPPPTTSPTDTESPSAPPPPSHSPSTPPSNTPPPPPSHSPTNSCSPWDPTCGGHGGDDSSSHGGGGHDDNGGDDHGAGGSDPGDGGDTPGGGGDNSDNHGGDDNDNCPSWVCGSDHNNQAH